MSYIIVAMPRPTVRVTTVMRVSPSSVVPTVRAIPVYCGVGHAPTVVDVVTATHS